MPHNTEADFWARVTPTGFCWYWDRAAGNGYGYFTLAGIRGLAHRMAYEFLVGPIPEGLVLDHLCRTPLCVNPDHLDPVPQGENVRRGNAGRWGRSKTHCPQGHEYTPENTVIHSNNGGRICRTCKNEAGRRRYAAR